MTTLVPQSAVDAAEEIRLRALHGLGVIGTGPEERFDRITRLARRLFGVSIAAITLVDRDTQWIKSAIGFDQDRTARVDAFCDLTVANDDTTTIADAHADPRVQGNPYVVGPPNVRFYAGHPLHAAGQPVGTLCVFDAEPRELDDSRLAILRELAGWAESELNRTAELDRAAEVQQALQPRTSSLDVPGYLVTGACWPARSVGGDFVDWYRATDGDVVLTLGDVMGKGIGAALMMATVRAVLRTSGRELEPAEAVAEAARALEPDLDRAETMVTVCHTRVDVRTGLMTSVDAGHGLMFTHRADGRVLRPRPDAGGLPLGTLPDGGWTATGTWLRPGDTALAFSDGLVGLFPTLDDTVADLASAMTRDPQGIVDHVGDLVAAALEQAPLADDVTVQVIRRCP